MKPVWLIVPVKPFAESKSRLTNTLSPAQRAQLSRALLRHVLHTAADSRLFEKTLVVSRDPSVAKVTERFGVELLHEQGNDLNAALTQARASAMDEGARTILILPSDLPRLAISDLQQLTAAGAEGHRAVFAASRDGGTNALLLQPPDLIDFAFGTESFARHAARAYLAGVEPCVIGSPTLAFDLDSPTDLAELIGERMPS